MKKNVYDAIYGMRVRKGERVNEGMMGVRTEGWDMARGEEVKMVDSLDRMAKLDNLMESIGVLLKEVEGESDPRMVYKRASVLTAKAMVSMMFTAEKDSDKLAAMKAVQDRAMGKPVERRIEANVSDFIDSSEKELDDELRRLDSKYGFVGKLGEG